VSLKTALSRQSVTGKGEKYGIGRLIEMEVAKENL
jgi:hypothetical protein